MALTWAQCKAATNNSGNKPDISLFDNGYYAYVNYSSSYIDWTVYAMVYNPNDSAQTFDCALYLFARKTTSAPSQNDFDITFYCFGNTYNIRDNWTINSENGNVRYLTGHDFTGLTMDRSSNSNTIGAIVEGVFSTQEATGTWDMRKTVKFGNANVSASLSSRTTTSLTMSLSGLTTARNMLWYNNWDWRRSENSTWNRASRTDWSSTSTSTSISKTYSDMSPCTSYDLRFQYGAANYNPTTGSYNYVFVWPSKYWTVSGYTNAYVCSAPTVTNKEYNGSAQTGVSGGTGVSLGGTRSATNVGTYTATATPTASYNWTSTGVAQSSKQTKSYTWKITERSMSHCTVTVNTSEYTYDGTAKTPSVTVYDKDLGKNLSTSDYTVTYSNNTNPGTATVKVTGKRNYTGSISGSFTINKATGQLTANVSSLSMKRGDTATITLNKHGSTGTIGATVVPTQAINNNITVSVSGNTVTVNALSATESTINLVITMGADSYYTSDSITIPITIENAFKIYVGTHEVTKIYLGIREITSVFVGSKSSN